MVRRALVTGAVSLMVSVAGANTYTVTNDASTGVGSLRWAIGRANSHAGADTIAFADYVGGSIIRPLTPLPAITDDGTTIDGDLNGDGLPDIGVDGSLIDLGDDNQLRSAYGLRVLQADDCRIRGLVPTRWYQAGIWLEGSSRSQVTACHVGVNRGGTRAMPNGNGDIVLVDCSACVIGGASARTRNVLAGGSYATGGQGVWLRGGASNKLIGNYMGIRRDGSGALGNGHVGDTGVFISGGTGHRIGGARALARNVIGGVYAGVVLTDGSAGTVIAGNLIGLAADGQTLAPVETSCITLRRTSTRTVIGGTTLGARNVLAGSAYSGVSVGDEANGRVVIQGNYFGTNAPGTAHRGLMQIGVDEGSTGHDVVIGGSTAAARNVFAVSGGMGIRVHRTSDPLIQSNVFGLFVNGENADPMLDGILVTGESDPAIRDNEVANALAGVAVSGMGAMPGIFRNQFHHCGYAVYVMEQASCRLGNLGNVATGDDGRNLFDPSNTWHIYNSTANDIRAEGNDFGTHLYAKISDKIHDQVDNGALGLVDFDPLLGGVSPSGGATASLAVTGASAVPTAAGAEVIFTLSAPAEVTVEILNIAGRRVAHLADEGTLAAGSHRIVWGRETAAGLRAPAGRYMARIGARSATGQEATGLCAVSLP